MNQERAYSLGKNGASSMWKTITIMIFLISSPSFGAESQDYFPKMKACFLLYNMKTQKFEKVIGEKICRTQYTAYSTFKVPLAVMAFDSGVLKDENVVFKWDGVKSIREVANHDHNAKTWMRDSIVWYSQRITALLGKEKLQKYLNDFNYGNKNIQAGLKESWLVDPNKKSPSLKISPYEQVEFMKKLWTNTLPASKRSMDLTKELTYLETSPKGLKLSGKTGSGIYNRKKNMHLGWFIGHLENKDSEYIIVTNIHDQEASKVEGYGGLRSKDIAKKILADNNLW